VAELKTTDEVAQELRVSKAAVYRWVEEGRLRAIRVGSLLRFTDEAIGEFLAASTAGKAR
jgi:excisionase family DNA binding protein